MTEETLNEWLIKRGMKPVIPKRDIHICRANLIASTDTINFEKLTQFAKDHPYIMADIMRAYKKNPDDRFGDNLAIFCSLFNNGYIDLKK